MTVSHPTSVADRLERRRGHGQEGQSVPIADAQVCLWKGSEIYVTAHGRAGLRRPACLCGDGRRSKITVTKHNRYPYAATIPVATSTAYVSYLASTIDDDNAGNSIGNGDGSVNPGEAIELPVQLKNFGTQLAPGVTAHTQL